MTEPQSNFDADFDKAIIVNENIRPHLKEIVEFGGTKLIPELEQRQKELGRVTGILENGGLISVDLKEGEVFFYGLDGVIASKVENNGNICEYSHDGKGRITEQKIKSPKGDITKHYSYAYETDDPSSLHTIFIHNPDGSLKNEYAVDTPLILAGKQNKPSP